MNTYFNAATLSKDIRKLFSEYSTIETDHKLKKNLCNTLNISYNDFDKIENIRSLYNECLLKYYPNEASVKANFINKILLNGKTHVTIFELPVGRSRVDLCKINGTSVAYEIKTDYDTFYRLEKQIYDYSGNEHKIQYRIRKKDRLINQSFFQFNLMTLEYKQEPQAFIS